jgi:hypothetical protein
VSKTAATQCGGRIDFRGDILDFTKVSGVDVVVRIAQYSEHASGCAAEESEFDSWQGKDILLLLQHPCGFWGTSSPLF